MFNANSKYTSICCGFEEHDIGLYAIQNYQRLYTNDEWSRVTSPTGRDVQWVEVPL